MDGYVIPTPTSTVPCYEDKVREGTDPFVLFDPNKSLEGTWGVWDGGRFEVARTRGGAVTRFNSCAEAKIYQLTSDGWVERAVRAPWPKALCDRCGRPITSSHRVHLAYPYRGGWRWLLRRTAGGKIIYPLESLCYCGEKDCR